jgi:hypothetical protein
LGLAEAIHDTREEVIAGAPAQGLAGMAMTNLIHFLGLPNRQNILAGFYRGLIALKFGGAE